MNTTIDFNVLSIFMSFESVTYLHYFVSSDRAVCIIFSLIPHHIIPSSRVYLSQTHSIMSVFVTESRLTVSRVYLFCNAILAEREEASLQTDLLASDSLPR